MYFSAEAKETVVSPTDTGTSHLDVFESWQQINKVTDRAGTIRFYSNTGFNSVTADLTMINKLWYIKHIPQSRTHHSAITIADNNIHNAVIHRAKSHEYYELWHHQYGYAGESTMQRVGK